MTLFLLLYLTSALAFSLPPPVTVVATTPSDLTNRNGSQHPTADLLHTQASDNTTLSDPWVICSGDRFGFGMSVMGCASAVFQMDSMTSTEESWGIRRTGSFDHPLPQRWIGGKLWCRPNQRCGSLTHGGACDAASGTCRVDIGLVPGTHFGRASPQDFQKGAAAVLEKCVSQRNPSEGGATVQIGVFFHSSSRLSTTPFMLFRFC